MLDPADLLTRYREQYAAYKEMVGRVEADLKVALADLSEKPMVSGRAKDPAHFVLKALKKFDEEPERYADPLNAMPDKAGVRVIVSHLDGVTEVLDRITAAFDVIDVDDKRSRLSANELGYLGCHVQVRLLDGRLGPDRHLATLECEIQIHTRAQNAWSEVSHPLLYKPVGGPPPFELESRIMRAVALVSLFDDEIDAARERIMSDPQFRPAAMFDILQKAAIDWRRGDGGDVEVSLWVLRVLELTYSDEELHAENFKQLIADFIEGHRAELDVVYGLYPAGALDLLDQPEAVAVYERLVNAPKALRAAWQDSDLPLEFLEQLSTAFATPT